MRRSSRIPRQSPDRHRRWRPGLEALEDRKLLTVVTNASGNPLVVGSLPYAVALANSSPSFATEQIVFNIPGSTVQTITLTDDLVITAPDVAIDGYTQHGANTNADGTPPIVIDGAGSFGVVVKGQDAMIGGLVIDHYGGTGLTIDTHGSANIVGNFIGTNQAGTAASGGQVGIEIDGVALNTIGGTGSSSFPADPADGFDSVTFPSRNVISGNSVVNILVSGAGASANSIKGNLIGTNAAGTAGLGNNGIGVEIADGANSNTIGGTSTATGNRISGNGLDGVLITGAGTAKNLVTFNAIGAEFSGAKGLGNGGNGVEIADGASSNTIGSGNVLAANHLDGVLIAGAGTTKNVVTYNRIGTDLGGATGLGNKRNGVEIAGGASGNTIGGISLINSNTIVGNTLDGVLITGSGTVKNLVEFDAIGTDIGGTTGLGNGANGVEIAAGASSNTIGATNAPDTIASNHLDGVLITGAGTSKNVVVNSKIGTDFGGHLSLGNSGNGVQIAAGASSNTIGGTAAFTGNTIVGNKFDGVLITRAGATGINVTSANVVASNTIGQTATGMGNGGNGVEIAAGAANNTIGGANISTMGGASAGNTIAGNHRDGVLLTGTTTTGNFLAGNTISGNTAGHGASHGVEITAGAHGNTIGATTAAYRNTISGNGGNGILITGGASNQVVGDAISGNGLNGILITGAGASGNIVLSNTITGNTAGGSLSNGIMVAAGAGLNTIGKAGYGNTITGNGNDGILITGAGTAANAVAGNSIGTTDAGKGNAANGVEVAAAATSNTIGGTTAAAGNSIAGNGLNGVLITGAGTAKNLVTANTINANTAHATASNGVMIAAGAYQNTVGGTASGSRNTITNNGHDGVLLTGAGTKLNVVVNNTISGNANVGVESTGGATNNTISGNGPQA